MTSGFDDLNFHPDTRFSEDPSRAAKQQGRLLITAEKRQARQEQGHAAQIAERARLGEKAYRQQLIAEIIKLKGDVFRFTVATNSWNCTFLSLWRKRAGLYLGPGQRKVDFWLGTNRHVYYSNNKWRWWGPYDPFVYYKSRARLKGLATWQLERLRDQLKHARGALS